MPEEEIRQELQDDQDNSTPSRGRRHPASAVSWVALAIAILVAGYLVRGAIQPDDLRPGGDTSGLPQVGESAPDFEAIDASGNLVALSEFEGQPIWLNFWGSWCPPCRAEAPDMIRAWNQVKDSGVVLVAVSLEEPSEDAFNFAEEMGMEFVVLSDPNREAIRGKYRVRSFPTHLFIDSSGNVREISLTPLSTNSAVQMVDEIT